MLIYLCVANAFTFECLRAFAYVLVFLKSVRVLLLEKQDRLSPIMNHSYNSCRQHEQFPEKGMQREVGRKK